MQIYNQPSRTERNAEFGHVWEEKLSGASGSIEVPKYSAIRVRAVAGLTVTVGGILAATMISDEILIFNAGIGEVNDKKRTVTITVSGSAFVQVSRMTEKIEDIIS